MPFSNHVICWYEQNKRDLPWRNTKDPYKIWLSEIILQQTRVAQGLPYYERFITDFPTVDALALAEQEEVLKLWQGLGYYSRARNLHHAAKQIVKDFGSNFPNKYEDILSLKGIGEYTAAAVSSFAFNLPYAVVDGNVFRLLARYFGIDTAINSTGGKKLFFELANELLDKNRPGDYNQAIMEFGSQKCKPSNPECESCPLQENCVASQQKQVHKLPVKLKKTKIKKLFFNYLYIHFKGNTFIKKRTEKGIWQNLYDFPLIEEDKASSEKEILKEIRCLLNVDIETFSTTKEYKHILSHRIIYARFWKIKVIEEPTFKNVKKIKINSLEIYPVPKLIESFLHNERLTNSL